MALEGIRKHHIIVIGYQMGRFMPKSIGEDGTGDVAVVDVGLKFGKFKRNWRIKNIYAGDDDHPSGPSSYGGGYSNLMASADQTFRQLFDMILHTSHMGREIGRDLGYLHLGSIRLDSWPWTT
jgi:hypothetical protein